MALIKCPECGKEVSDKAEMCPNCGYKIASSNNNKRNKKINKPLFFILGVVIIVMILVIIFFATEDIRKVANDNTPPEFENSITEMSTMVGEEINFDEWLTSADIKVTDDVSESISIKIDDSAVDFKIPGTYIVTLTAVDDAENVAKEEITVIVNDYPAHKAYEDAVNLSYEQLDMNSIGTYSFNGITISEAEADNIEDGSIYRSIAQQLEGFYVLGTKYYSNWGNDVIPLVSGSEKADTWEDMRTYMDAVTLFISRKVNVGAIMSIFQSLNSVDGSFDYLNGTFSFTISDLTKAAQELNITEEMLGYILAMLEEYGPETSFANNSYNCELKFYGQRGIDETDYISYENWDQELNLLSDMEVGAYKYYYWFDPNTSSDEEIFGIFTNRYLRLKHSIDAVIFSHAGGEVKTYQTDDDIMYQALVANGDSNYKYLEECTKYIAYTVGDVGNIVYYFNSSNELMFIAYTNMVVY